ncbi:HNH endonuclease [Mammaliicoccus sciuri]|uniref:HNH endonuclease n=1 Tax=Mammaliicoccus sciuri TaxID=1296 RepID=UPI0034DCDC60
MPRTYRQAMSYYPKKYTPPNIWFEEGVWWATIPFAKDYAVSNTGIVRGKRAGMLKQTSDKDGYKIVTVYGENRKPNQCRVHRLVAVCFLISLNKPSERVLVNHINGVKDDNDVRNLEWVTPKENTQHAFSSGLIPVRYGVSSKLSEREVYDIFVREESFEVLASTYEVSYSNIAYIKSGKGWKWLTSEIKSNGKGFISWDEVLERLEEIGKH